VVGGNHSELPSELGKGLESCLSVLSAPRPQADGSDKSVDLSVSLAIDHPPGFSFCRTSGASGKATAAVPVLDCLDVPEIPGSPAPGAPATHGDGKAIDAVALTGLILSIPPAALAVLDLPDRIRKRRRAQELIDHAQQLATLQITIYLQLPTRTVELSALTPDQLLDLQDDERPDD